MNTIGQLIFCIFSHTTRYRLLVQVAHALICRRSRPVHCLLNPFHATVARRSNWLRREVVNVHVRAAMSQSSQLNCHITSFIINLNDWLKSVGYIGCITHTFYLQVATQRRLCACAIWYKSDSTHSCVMRCNPLVCIYPWASASPRDNRKLVGYIGA